MPFASGRGVGSFAAVVLGVTSLAELDRALRTRSAHVSAGIGAAMVGALAGGGFLLAGIVAWVLMANTNVVSKKIVR